MNPLQITPTFRLIGCGPRGIDRPELNTRRKAYRANPDGVFLSFAASRPAALMALLTGNPAPYAVMLLERSA